MFDAHQVHVIHAGFLSRFEQVVIDLARAHHDTADLVVFCQLHLAFATRRFRVIPQDAVERGFRRHVVERGGCQLVTQQRLGRHDDQRLAEVTVDLATDGMEIVRRGRQVADLHIVFGAHLQEAFETGGGVFRPLPLIAMRQETDET